jgi:malate synthase
MEDRATCRISAQHIANWLHHGVVSEAQVMEILRRMAGWWTGRTRAIRPMCRWRRASTASPLPRPVTWCSRGAKQPSGYTEPVLHARRLELKAA